MGGIYIDEHNVREKPPKGVRIILKSTQVAV